MPSRAMTPTRQQVAAMREADAREADAEDTPAEEPGYGIDARPETADMCAKPEDTRDE